MKPSRCVRDLIDKAQSGDREAFGELVARYTGRTESLIRRLLGAQLKRVVEVEDLAQETFLRALRSFEQFRGDSEETLWCWLKTIAEHVVKDQARHHKVRLAVLGQDISQAKNSSDDGEVGSLEDLLVAKDSTPSKILRRKERFERLEQAVSRLGPDHRKVILLARVRGLPIKEVARLMGRSPKAVSMLLLRAALELKRTFDTTGSLSLPAELSLSEERSGGGNDRPPNGPSDLHQGSRD